MQIIFFLGFSFHKLCWSRAFLYVQYKGRQLIFFSVFLFSIYFLTRSYVWEISFEIMIYCVFTYEFVLYEFYISVFFLFKRANGENDFIWIDLILLWFFWGVVLFVTKQFLTQFWFDRFLMWIKIGLLGWGY